jgi:hypothetical protein
MAATVLAGWLAGVVIGPGLQPRHDHGTPAISALLGNEASEIEELP